MNIAIFAVFCAFVGAVPGYCIAKKQSQHAMFAARAKGILDGRNDGAWEQQSLRLELQRLRLRNRQLEAKEQVIRIRSLDGPS
jgi:hypothetical protein